MTRKEQIHLEIERTLHSFDNIKKAEANSFLFTRIKARIRKNDNVWERALSFMSRPVIAFSIVLLIMAVNAWALWSTNLQENLATENNNGATSELASQYNNVSSVNNYDFSNFSQ